MSVRQVWKRKTPLPKSSPTCLNDSPPPPSRNTPHSISPPMNYPQRDQIINQLHTISTLIDSETPTPTSLPYPLVRIYQKSHGNNQKRASTDTRLRRVQKEAKESKPKPEKSSLRRIDAINADEEITLVSVHDVNLFAGEEVFATTVDDITLAQVLKEMKSTKPKKKRVIIQELGESTTTISSQLSSQQSQDKGKGILIEPVKPMNKKDLIRLDEETALNLQAEFDEEERLAREKAEKEEEANIALIET
ncbi:hypothetical protein Tco_0741709 [Tanacetum coccineum]